MQLKLTYQEVEQMIAAKAGRSVPMGYGGDHTLRISPEVNVLFKTATIGLDITVDHINGSDVFLSYSGGAGIEFMVRTALNQAKNKMGDTDALEILDGNRLMLSLGKNPQMAALFERLELQDIHFDATSIMIDFKPKQF